MLSIEPGQELQLSIQSIDQNVNSRTKSLRYVNPLAAKCTEKNLTGLARLLFAASTNTYKATKGSINLGYLAES